MKKQYKQELKFLLDSHLKDESGEDKIAILGALGEVTAELGIGVVGHHQTTALFRQLADQVQSAEKDLANFLTCRHS